MNIYGYLGISVNLFLMPPFINQAPDGQEDGGDACHTWCMKDLHYTVATHQRNLND